MSKPVSPPVFTMSMLITGNLLGGGILAVPVILGPAGLIPALTGIFLMWGLMFYTALIYADQKSLVENETADLPTFFGREMGGGVKWITIIANLIILYGVLVAYLTGVTSIIDNLFHLSLPKPLVLFFYFIIAAGLTSLGMGVLRRGNAVLMFFIWAAFAVLVFLTARHGEPQRLASMEWRFFPMGLPILVTAFHFHNLIPTICRTLNQDKRAIRRAIFMGTFTGVIMHSVWLVVVSAALPVEGPGQTNIMYALANNLPATVPLSQLFASNTFTQVGLAFAVVAMTAAFVANGTALMSFIRDLTTTHLNSQSRPLIWLFAFAPPLAVALMYPQIFLIAMNVVGGIGEDIIFGILPGIILLKYSEPHTWKHYSGYMLVIVFGLILLLELGQEFGLLHISPDLEYWTAKH